MNDRTKTFGESPACRGGRDWKQTVLDQALLPVYHLSKIFEVSVPNFSLKYFLEAEEARGMLFT